jgi:hypothetical protein
MMSNFLKVVVIVALLPLIIGPAVLAHAQTQETIGGKSVMVFLKSIVINDLSDPGSARFRNMVLYKRIVEENGKKAGTVYVLCGDLNAKNHFGGYIGFGMFIAKVRTRNGHLVEYDSFLPGEEDTEDAVAANCNNSVYQISNQ